MTDLTMTAPRFDIGRVVKLTFGAVGRNWLVFGLLAVLLSGVPQALLGWTQTQMQGNPSGAFSVLPVFVLEVLLTIVASYVLQAAVVYGTVADLNGRRATFGECIAIGLRNLLPLIGLGILMGIALGFGFLLLIVPGVLMGLAWIVAVPVVVVERTGVMASFGRSADLTRNHRLAIFALVILFVVIFWIGIIVVGVFTAVFTLGFAGNLTSPVLRLAIALVTAVLQAVVGALGAAGIAAIYYELRSIKEGVGPEQLAAVFD